MVSLAISAAAAEEMRKQAEKKPKPPAVGADGSAGLAPGKPPVPIPSPPPSAPVGVGGSRGLAPSPSAPSPPPSAPPSPPPPPSEEVGIVTRLPSLHQELKTKVYQDKPIDWTPIKEIKEVPKDPPSLFGRIGERPKSKDPYVKKPSVSRAITETQKGVSTPYEYLVKHAEPSSVSGLKILPYLPIYGKFSELTSGRIIDRAFGSLTTHEKSVFGFRYTDWEKIPVSDIQYYPGGFKYLSSLSAKQRESTVTEYMGSSAWQKYVSSPIGKKQVDVIAKGEYAKTLQPGEVSAMALYDYGASKRILAEKIVFVPEEKLRSSIYADLGLRTRIRISVSEASISAVTFPITLTQLGMKYITGKGEWTDPGSRIVTGHTFGTFDLGKHLAETKVSATEGLISGTIGEAISGGESDFFESAWKYPVETGFSTGAEVIGLLIGGKAIHTAKVGLGKGYQAFKGGVSSHFGITIPSFPRAYTPKNIIRTAYWKGRTKLGYGVELQAEIGFASKTLPHGLSYAPGKTSAERISATVKAFEKTTVVSKTGEKFMVGIHATESSWFKPFTWLRKGRESPGVSFAPFGKGASRFLRTGGGMPLDYSTSGISLFPKFKLPTAPLLFFKQLKQLPSSIRNLSYKITGKFIKRDPGVYIAPKLYVGGGEYEAVARGIAVRKGVRFWTRIEGVTVPMPEFQLLEKGGLSFTQRIGTAPFLKSAKEFVSPFSYTGKASIPLLSPSYLGSVIGRSYVSTPSSFSYVSKPGYTFGSSIPSEPSYLSKPSMPSLFSYPSKSSMPSYVSKPSYKSKPSTFSYPSYPSKPSAPSYPSYPSKPSYPSYPSYSSSSSSSITLFLLLDSGGKPSKRRRKPLDPFDIGYRHREWKVLRMEDLVGGYKIWVGLRKKKK